MRRAILSGLGITLVACVATTSVEAPANLQLNAFSGSFRYAATWRGVDALAGTIYLLRTGDSMTGVWNIRDINSTDPAQPGCVVGVGRLEGYVTGDTLVHLFMNPGWADCNVTLALRPTSSGFQGQWDLVGFAGPMAQGNAALVRFTPGPD